MSALSPVCRGLVGTLGLSSSDTGLLFASCGFDAHIVQVGCSCFCVTQLYEALRLARPVEHFLADHRAYITKALKISLSVHLCCMQLVSIFSGGALAIAKPGSAAVTDAAYMAGLLRGQGVTWLAAVPSLSLLYLGALAAQPCPSLRALISGGEALVPLAPGKTLGCVWLCCKQLRTLWRGCVLPCCRRGAAAAAAGAGARGAAAHAGLQLLW